MDSTYISSANIAGMQCGLDSSSLLSRLKTEHQKQLEELVLTKRPFETLKLFALAVLQYLRQSAIYVMTRGLSFFLLIILGVVLCFMLFKLDGPHEKLVDEILNYVRFGLWWVGLGVASSIGLGSGLHTFVLYLGPHIAFFTIKATQCGRVDLKSAPYDTILLNRGSSWIDKDCSEIGPPLYPHLLGSERFMVPLQSILPQVQLEAVLWGIGTALGELPPYFVSRAAHLSGKKLEELEELDAPLDRSGTISLWMMRLKRWTYSKSQHLNFFTILILASVPNPLFDLAGIMCGQLSVSFWRFFTATLIGKALIKTHIQTVFIILVCNNQLVEWLESELIHVLHHIPALSRVLPHLMSKVHNAREKFHHRQVMPPRTSKAEQWNFSFAFLWNTFVWLMLMGFCAKIITGTAQGFLKERQKTDIDALAVEEVSKKDPTTAKSLNEAVDLKSE
eukprot:Gb_17299 [translate_table: standard]